MTLSDILPAADAHLQNAPIEKPVSLYSFECGAVWAVNEMLIRRLGLIEIPDPGLLDMAIRITISEQRGSTSLLQRVLQVDYDTAKLLVSEMADIGIVGPFKGASPRDVLFSDVGTIDRFLNYIANII